MHRAIEQHNPSNLLYRGLNAEDSARVVSVI